MVDIPPMTTHRSDSAARHFVGQRVSVLLSASSSEEVRMRPGTVTTVYSDGQTVGVKLDGNRFPNVYPTRVVSTRV